MPKTYHLFISHSWSYSDVYQRLTDLLHERPYFSFHDHSVPKDDPVHDAKNEQELYDAIKRQMSGCHIVLIMAGVYATYSKWIKKEIKIAQNEFANPKPILAIRPWAQTNVSQVVSENSDEIVGWNVDSIVNAIRRLSL